MAFIFFVIFIITIYNLAGRKHWHSVIFYWGPILLIAAIIFYEAGGIKGEKLFIALVWTAISGIVTIIIRNLIAINSFKNKLSELKFHRIDIIGKENGNGTALVIDCENLKVLYWTKTSYKVFELDDLERYSFDETFHSQRNKNGNINSYYTYELVIHTKLRDLSVIKINIGEDPHPTVVILNRYFEAN